MLSCHRIKDYDFMSIKAIALELYRAQQKVNRLEARLEEAPLNEKDAVCDKLREAKAEWQVLRNILDGEKSTSPVRSHLSAFKRGN